LFYIALVLRTPHLSLLSSLAGVNATMSVGHNAVVLLRWVAVVVVAMVVMIGVIVIMITMIGIIAIVPTF